MIFSIENIRDYLKDRRKRSVIHSLAKDLPRELALAYGQQEFYSVDQLYETMAKKNYSHQFVIEALCLFLKRDDFDAEVAKLGEGVDYTTKCYELKRYGVGFGVPEPSTNIINATGYNLITKTYKSWTSRHINLK
ncbi:DUF6559 family protein [Pseudobacteriovorax antillogorgiicola]|uniref:Uncharacterized protein n=1 Tax=Pseudobacteriovorax antillogorgiicola TaxID=1513793 RepID=A0A1Y6BHW1_9BACT|nr:DUF6559 family protein [Pseudobacteriovorax antillogorgiicola]TCS55474.1 hypothetical protein EDD56_105195 [Pseudobacteriovorax antillogorgiicola]SMF12027.1 hypothetical protein SAMN06296036_105129 [Pseudobacteriovorax antillogorgiicola]